MTTLPPSEPPKSPQPSPFPQPQPRPQAPPQPVPVGRVAAAPAYGGPPRKKSWASRLLSFLFVSLFVLSVLMNLMLLAMLAMTVGGDGNLRTAVIEKGRPDQTVAVFTVEGVIDGKTSADFRRFFRQIRNDGDVKAVVLRVNSPGGTVSDSDEIHHLISQLRNEGNKLPVVVSMGGVAASGGYYISAGADHIFAEPTTVTGSVGVIGSWPVVKDFLNNHGVQMVMIRSRQAQGTKATENPFEKPSETTLANMENLLSTMHEQFMRVVREGRKGKLKETTGDVEITVPAAFGSADGTETRTVTQTQPLNGQVYLADDAIANGLVDQIGYLNDAIQFAAKQANLTTPHVVQYTRPRGLFGSLDAQAEPPNTLDPVKILDDLSTPRIMMMWKMD